MGGVPLHAPGARSLGRAPIAKIALSERRGALEIAAHRGDPTRAPENTLASLRAGIEAGAHAVEWDVRVCASGEPVVIHDETVDRTTDGRGRVDALRLDELRALDAGGWFSAAHAGERVPTLDEVLDLVAQEGRLGYCEVKALRSEADAARIVDAIETRTRPGRVAVISLRPEILKAFRRKAPELRLGWVVAREAEMPSALAWVRGDPRGLLAPAATLLLSQTERTRALVDEGLALGTWTVDALDEAATLASLGVHRITTNRVRDMVQWAREAR